MSIGVTTDYKLKFIVYYESIKREPKIRGINNCRCDERLQTKTKEFTRLPYTGLVLELQKTRKKKEKVFVLFLEKPKPEMVQEEERMARDPRQRVWKAPAIALAALAGAFVLICASTLRQHRSEVRTISTGRCGQLCVPSLCPVLSWDSLSTLACH